jgi:hypothetical protein
MSIRLGASAIIISWTLFLGACSSPEVKKTSQSEMQFMNQLVEANGEEQTTDDQEIFLLEQQTPDGEIVDLENIENSGLEEAPQEPPSK